MKLAPVLLLAALPALAQSPTQFQSAASLTLEGQGGLHRAALPFEAYKDARPDLGDVRVFNGAGEPVPIAYAGDPDVLRETVPPVDLPIFPVSSITPATSGGHSEVTVKTEDGTLVSIRGKSSSFRPIVRPAAVLVDASKVEQPMTALVFDWDAKPGTEVVKVRIEASDDLKSWSALGGGPLVQLENEGRTLKQPKVEFAGRKAKYLRITWDAQGFVVKSVRAEREQMVKPAPRVARVVHGKRGEKPDELVFDLGARLPVEAVRLVPATVNDVVAASLYTRNDPKERWALAATAPFYRMQVEGAEKQSPALELGKRSARHWLVKLSGRTADVSPPTLEVQWRASQVVFAARGNPPFTLAFGNAQAMPVALPITSMVPDYKPRSELALPEAKVGEVTTGPPPTRWEKIVADVSPKRLALWIVLIAGVAALGFMAWRLMKQSPR
jgi:hypothetical protein